MTSLRSTLTGVAVLVTAASSCSLSARGLGPLPIRGTHFEVGAAETSAPPGRDSEAAHGVQADDLIAKANARFNSGRDDYFQGDLPAARREFNEAIEILLSAPDSLADHARVERRLEDLCDIVYRFDVEKLGAGQSGGDETVAFDKAPIDEISHMTFPVDETLASRLQSELHKTSSAIPLELADPVLSYVHFFSSDRGRNILLSGFRRSGRYRPMIERIFAEEGVPQELIYLAQAESGFLPRAVSNKNAVGMWQFIAGTGSSYELTRTSDYDDRLDPEKATRAAARYMRDLYARYGDWYLAMAAYNCGAGAVDRAVERTGYSDYWELLKRHALPKETSNYVPIILAMTIIAKNPQDYGLTSLDVDPPADYDTIHVTARTSLELIADVTLQPVSAIHDLNPALLRSIAPAGFLVHVPKGTADTALASLETVPSGNRYAWRMHHVLTGDTLDSIAHTYHMPAERIVSVNRSADNLEAGDFVLIPAAYHEDAPARGGRSVRGRHGRQSRSAAASAVARSGRTRRSSAGTHIIASRRVSPQVLHRRAAVRTASR